MSGLEEVLATVDRNKAVVLDCPACGNPSGGIHAPGCDPARRIEHRIRQFARAGDSLTIEGIGELSRVISALSWQAQELISVRDNLSQSVWGCDYKDLP